MIRGLNPRRRSSPLGSLIARGYLTQRHYCHTVAFCQSDIEKGHGVKQYGLVLCSATLLSLLGGCSTGMSPQAIPKPASPANLLQASPNPEPTSAEQHGDVFDITGAGRILPRMESFSGGKSLYFSCLGDGAADLYIDKVLIIHQPCADRGLTVQPAGALTGRRQVRIAADPAVQWHLAVATKAVDFPQD